MIDEMSAVFLTFFFFFLQEKIASCKLVQQLQQ